jgi:hypothetical protein
MFTDLYEKKNELLIDRMKKKKKEHKFPASDFSK